MPNVGYVFAAYAAIWVVLFVYVFFLVRKQASLKRQMDDVREEFDRRRRD